MKKLFALLVILALCGAANAASIVLENAGGTIVADAGTTVTIYIVGEGSLVGMDACITITGSATLTAYVDASSAVAYGWDAAYAAPAAMLATDTFVELGQSAGGGSNINTPGYVGYVEVLFSGPEATVTMTPGSFWGGSSPVDPTEGFVNIIIPEPMTIALLGLGGLFIRRRK